MVVVVVVGGGGADGRRLLGLGGWTAHCGLLRRGRSRQKIINFLVFGDPPCRSPLSSSSGLQGYLIPGVVCPYAEPVKSWALEELR